MKILFCLSFIFLVKVGFAKMEIMAISNNGKFLLSKQSNENIFRLYNIKEKKVIDSFFVKPSSKLNISFSNNSKYFAFVDTLTNLNIYKLEEKKYFKIGKLNSSLTENLFFSIDDSSLISSYSTGSYGSGSTTFYSIYYDYLIPGKLKTFNYTTSVSESWDPNVYTIVNVKMKRRSSFTYNFKESKGIVKNELLLGFPNNDEINKKEKYVYTNLSPELLPNDIKFNERVSSEFYVKPIIIKSNNEDMIFVTFLNHSKKGLIIDAKSLKVISQIKTNDYIKGIFFSDDDKKVLILNSKNQLSLWDAKKGTLINYMDKSLVSKEQSDSANLDFGFWSNGRKKYVYYKFDCCKKEAYLKNNFYLLSSDNLKLKKKFENNETSLMNYKNYLINRYGFNNLSYIHPTKYFITFNYIPYGKQIKMNIYDLHTLKYLKNILNTDIRRFSYDAKFNDFEEINYLDKFIFISQNQILETNWSIIDFLNTLNLPNK